MVCSLGRLLSGCYLFAPHFALSAVETSSGSHLKKKERKKKRLVPTSDKKLARGCHFQRVFLVSSTDATVQKLARSQMQSIFGGPPEVELRFPASGLCRSGMQRGGEPRRPHFRPVTTAYLLICSPAEESLGVQTEWRTQ